MGTLKLLRDGEGDPSKIEIQAQDLRDLQVFLERRFSGIYPACAFLSAFSGSMMAALAKQAGASVEDCTEILETLKKAIDESFRQTMAAK